MTTGTATTADPADPADLLIDRNIRDSAPDKTLLSSVRTHGILVPIVCLQDGDGLRVRDGHRRTLAALDVGLAEIPVFVTETDATDPARVVAQYAINEHRAGLSDTERLDAWSQLAAFGISAADIATKTGEKKATVAAALSLTDLPAAASAIVKQTMTLEEAAELADFSDDPDTIDELITAAEHGSFEHAIDRKRNERDLAAAVAELSETLQAERLHHLQPNERGNARPLHQLRENGKHIDELAHRECPGHCVEVQSCWDWAQDADGRHVHTAAARATIWCRDFATHGHTDSWVGTGSARAAADPEALKAKRRETIANNKAMADAQIVRRNWLAEFAQRKTIPAGGAMFTAMTMLRLRDGHMLSSFAERRGLDLVAEWLGLDHADKLDARIAKATPARAQHLALVIQLATYEGGADKELWRAFGGWNAYYLEALQGFGYTLSDVEQATVDGAHRA
ncbi:MAG: ParB/RepB/Spo0J family partition protein [Actinobacteria bacterium]|nr:ParB/RepB/Spo0J family partition protein [Actinomycetota bacterium]